MTDNEIIKEFDLFLKYSAPEKLLNDVLDLINRVKAENSKLIFDVTSLKCDLASAQGEIEFLKQDEIARSKIKADAIKEFAERLQSRCVKQQGCLWSSDVGAVLNEMVGDNE